MKLEISKSFKTISEPTERTSIVAESFGLGLDSARNFEIVSGLLLDIRPGDVCYITGDSGGGKSTILQMISEKLSRLPLFGEILNLNTMDIEDNEILIEGAGDTFDSALSNLSLAGLSDAFLMIRKYNELSDGQKYRYKIARLISNPSAKVWICDEFLSTLDRETSKVVAFCLQKTARRQRKTLIVSTSHRDLFDDLKPSIYILKGYGNKCEIRYPETTRNFGACSLFPLMKLREGTREDYAALHEFHYRSDLPSTARKIFAMEYVGEVIGCIAYGAPPLHSKGRSTYLGYSPTPEEINRDIICIQRVVVHPKFRSIGLGAELVRKTLGYWSGQKKFVEAFAVMAKYNPFFEKADMKKVSFESDTAFEYKEKIARLEAQGISPKNLRQVLDLPKEKYEALVEPLFGELDYFSIRNVYGHDSSVDQSQVANDLRNDRDLFAKLLEQIAILSEVKAYFIYEIPQAGVRSA